MTDKERIKAWATEKGLEPSEIGCTLQWTTTETKETCIKFFTADGTYTGVTEWRK